MAWFRIPRWLVWLVATLGVATLAGVLAAYAVENQALSALTGGVRADAKLRAALLDSEIARYRLLALALADDQAIVAGIEGGVAERRALDIKLEAMARATGAPVIYVIAPSGIAVAASNWRTHHSFVGRDYNFRPYFGLARKTGAAEQFARGTVSGLPGLYLARRAGDGGVTVVKLEYARIEDAWRSAGGITSVRDDNGIVLVTSRPDWRYGTSAPLSSATIARFSRQASIEPGALRPLDIAPSPDGRGVVIRGQRYVVATAPTTEPGWTLSLMRPVDEALRLAWRAAMAGAFAAVLILSGLGWTVLERRARARRHTAELQRAVAERTIELQREMEVRAASDARAAELREGLRQANRLASLGQITASVAHETAQPVAAIRTYSQTSETLLERGDLDTVRSNLAAIRRLAERIGSVTAELRGFARRGTGQLRAVSLAEVVDGAVLILREQLSRIALELPRLDQALHVIGGRIRLEQVLVNLLQNAIEALSDRADGRIRVMLSEDAETVRLTVSDDGPGIPPEIADRLFTPFVTSRANGLGLGLVIAQDIMAECGGSLRLIAGEGGATFEIAMKRA